MLSSVSVSAPAELQNESSSENPAIVQENQPIAISETSSVVSDEYLIVAKDSLYLDKCSFFLLVGIVVLLLVQIFAIGWRE